MHIEDEGGIDYCWSDYFDRLAGRGAGETDTLTKKR